jgi:hypothetical protein
MDPKPHIERDLTKTSPTQLALLMGLDETQSLWSENEHSAMMRHLLESPIPGDPTSSGPGQTFSQLLFAHHPDAEHLRRVKEFAKSCRTNPHNGLPEDIATVLYYAAIAVARLRCKHPISQLSAVELRDGIEWSLARNWLPDALKHLFHAAARELSASFPLSQ